jgi:hypothetical protein
MSMEPQQRYLLDLQGFLVVEDVLDQHELVAARTAADRYIDGVFEGEPPLPPGFYAGRKGTAVPGHSNFQHAWAFDPALERLAMHPKIWPIVLELTGGRPQMNGPGTMIVDDAQVRPPPPRPTLAGWLALQLHCHATARWNLAVALRGSAHSCSVDGAAHSGGSPACRLGLALCSGRQRWTRRQWP